MSEYKCVDERIAHVSCSSAPVFSSISEPRFCRSISSTSRNDCLQIKTQERESVCVTT